MIWILPFLATTAAVAVVVAAPAPDFASALGSTCLLNSTSSPGCTLVHINPLKGLKPLKKPHLSWPIPTLYLNSSRGFLDGVMLDFVRITGGCSIDAGSINKTNTCVELCAATKTSRAAAKLPPSVVVFNYSPWYAKFPGRDPRITGAPEVAELSYYKEQLQAVASVLRQSKTGVQMGAILLDSEKFNTKSINTTAFRAALTRKHDLIWNVSQAVFPGVRIELYNRGSVEKWDTDPTWRQNQHRMYTLEEQGSSFSISLYTIPEILREREYYTRTVAAAMKYNMSGPRPGTTTAVTPWLALGCGNLRVPQIGKRGPFSFTFNYEMVYSWQMGLEINNPYYGDSTRETMYAPWRYATAVAMYPSIFDTRAIPAGPGSRSTSMMQHFVSYVRGANELNGVAPNNLTSVPDSYVDRYL